MQSITDGLHLPEMMMHTPSFHNISPLTRSGSTRGLRRVNSTGTFTLPSYGYGGGYMSRSLSRSGSVSLFGRSLAASSLARTPPLHSVAVQRSTPHYSDKYPYVRYSYGNTDTGQAILSQSESTSPYHYSVRDLGTKRWLEGKLNAYNTGLFTKPNYGERVERPIAPSRNYVRYMGVDDALNMYKKKCMTVGTLSKYWLSPATWASRREKEWNLSTASSQGNYSYASRYSGNTPRSTFSSRLTSTY